MKIIEEIDAAQEASQSEVQKILTDFSLLSKVYDHGTKDTPMWFRNIVLLAYRAMRAKALREALALLSIVPRTYFADTLASQMEEDAAYCRLVLDLCSLLVDTGLASPNFQTSDLKLTTTKVALA